MANLIMAVHALPPGTAVELDVERGADRATPAGRAHPPAGAGRLSARLSPSSAGPGRRSRPRRRPPRRAPRRWPPASPTGAGPGSSPATDPVAGPRPAPPRWCAAAPTRARAAGRWPRSTGPRRAAARAAARVRGAAPTPSAPPHARPTWARRCSGATGPGRGPTSPLTPPLRRDVERRRRGAPAPPAPPRPRRRRRGRTAVALGDRAVRTSSRRLSACVSQPSIARPDDGARAAGSPPADRRGCPRPRRGQTLDLGQDDRIGDAGVGPQRRVLGQRDGIVRPRAVDDRRREHHQVGPGTVDRLEHAAQVVDGAARRRPPGIGHPRGATTSDRVHVGRRRDDADAGLGRQRGDDPAADGVVGPGDDDRSHGHTMACVSEFGPGEPRRQPVRVPRRPDEDVHDRRPAQLADRPPGRARRRHRRRARVQRRPARTAPHGGAAPGRRPARERRHRPGHSQTGRIVSVRAVTRAEWAYHTLDHYRSLFEGLAGALTASPMRRRRVQRPDRGHGPGHGLLGSLPQVLGPFFLGAQAGTMCGHLARQAMGQYDLPIPRPVSDELMVVPAAITAFAADWSIPVDDVRLWVCLSELTHHAVLGRPHVRERLDEPADRSSSRGFRVDPTALSAQLEQLDLNNPSTLPQLFNNPEALLGAVTTPAQHEVETRLAALVSAIEGYVDHVVDTRRPPADLQPRPLERGAEAPAGHPVGRRRADPRVVRPRAVTVGLRPGRPLRAGVLERAGDDGLARLWRSEHELPTPAEVDAPGPVARAHRPPRGLTAPAGRAWRGAWAAASGVGTGRRCRRRDGAALRASGRGGAAGAGRPDGAALPASGGHRREIRATRHEDRVDRAPGRDAVTRWREVRATRGPPRRRKTLAARPGAARGHPAPAGARLRDRSPRSGCSSPHRRARGPRSCGGAAHGAPSANPG